MQTKVPISLGRALVLLLLTDMSARIGFPARVVHRAHHLNRLATFLSLQPIRRVLIRRARRSPVHKELPVASRDDLARGRVDDLDPHFIRVGHLADVFGCDARDIILGLAAHEQLTDGLVGLK